MTKLRVIGAAIWVSFAISSAAFAQTATRITGSEVVGEWTLTFTPAERRGFSVTVESDDGGRPDLTLDVTARSGGALTCVVGGDPAECRVKDGKLVITSARTGGTSMTFTLTDRARAGFSGNASVRARLLPFGTQIGSVNMTRR